MRLHYVQTYMDFFGYVEQDVILSEYSGKPADDIHHIVFRSHGGDDSIENLIALTREEHDQAHGKKQPTLTERSLFDLHQKRIRFWVSYKKGLF